MAASPTLGNPPTQPDDDSWIDHPTGMEGLPQPDAPFRKPVELSPDDVEVEQPQARDQPAQQKPTELSPDDVEIQGEKPEASAQQPAPDEDMRTAPPSWAANPAKPPEPNMQEESVGRAVMGSPEARAAAANHIPGIEAASGKPLMDPLTGIAHNEKAGYDEFKAGLSMLPEEHFAGPQADLGTPEQRAQAVEGFSRMGNGIMTMTAPVLAADIAANPKVIFTIAKGVGLGYIGGEAAQKATSAAGFSQPYQDLAKTIGFFIPGAVAHIVASSTPVAFGEGRGNVTDYFRPKGATEPGSGRVSTFTGASPEEFTAGARVGGKTFGVRIPRRGPFAETQPPPEAPGQLPGQPVPPPPPPDPAAVTAAKDEAAGAQAVQATAESRAEAQRVQQGQPPVPEKPMPAGMDKGILKPEVVTDLARAAQLAGPEAQPEIVKEAHANMAGWMAKAGTVVLPNGKVEVVDTPKKAATVAAGVINDEIDRQTKQKEETAKLQQTAADSAKQQEDERKASIEQRAKTILAANPDHPDPTGLLARNLGVDRPTAEALSRRIQTPAEAQAAPLVGSPTHQVTEEPPAQVDAQLEALKKGTVPVVMLPEGSRYEPELPPGMKKLTVSGDSPGAGTYIYDPKKIRPATIKEAAKAGTHGDLLGHVATKEEVPAMQQPTVLQARQNGQPVQESVVDAAKPGQIRAQHDQLAERHPGAEIRAVTPEQVHAERAAQPQAKQEEANAVQKSEAGEVREHAGRKEEIRGGEREGVQPGEQGHEVAGEGARPEEVAEYQTGPHIETRKPEIVQALRGLEETKPVLDLHKEPTGWLAIRHNNGTTLIHPRNPELVDFKSRDAKSGTDVYRAHAEAQAYAIDHPVTKDVFDQAEEKKEEPAGDVFDQVEKHLGDRRAERRGEDRRQNPEQRRKVSQMSPEELRQELMTSHTAGLPNRRAFDDAEEEAPAPAVAMSDADGLKAFNDKFGYEAGNALLRAKGDALREAGLDAYHDKGDEFLYRGGSTEELTAKLDKAREILKATPITVTMTDGTTKQFQGADFSHGTGPNLASAEAGLKEHKSEREAAGERARGELRGIAETRPEKGGEGDSGEHKYEYGNTQHNLDRTSRAAVAIDNLRESIPDADLAGDGKDVDVNHVTVRYGLRGDTEGVRSYLASQKPFVAKLGKLEVFPPTKNSDGAAVLVARVDSPHLTRMNAEIQQHGNFKESDFPDYKPHVTVAYLKPEAADKYLKGGSEIEGQTFRVGSVAISDRDGNKQDVKLAGSANVTQPTTRKEETEQSPVAGTPEQAKPGSPATPAKPTKGGVVTFTDAKGNERKGTVAHVNGIVTRIKGEDGKEYTVATRKVRASEPAAPPTSDNSAVGGRAPGSVGGPDRAAVAEVPPGVLQEPAASGESGVSSTSNGDRVHRDAERLPEPGTGSGSGTRSDTGIDRAEPREVALDDAPAQKTIEKANKQLAKAPPARNKAWFSHPAEWQPPTGEAGKLDANIAALKLLREIEKTPRRLNDDEKYALANYTGWGALSKAFDPYTAPRDQWDRWKRANDQLHELLSPEEFAAARKSTLNAHYTSPELVRFMWDVMKRLGFKSGNVLEPSMGTGNFFGMMPKAIRGAVHAIGNELDPITAAIAKQLYPDATLHAKDFAELMLPNDDMDLAISNVPFGDFSLYDPKYPKLRAPIHDYFFVKSLDKVKPGGILAFITSTGMMDKQNDNVRQILGSKANLLGAIRLPSDAFKKSAGTSVTTDLIILQKRASGEAPNAQLTGNKWMKTREMEAKDRRGGTDNLLVNEYFHDHPEMMLGTVESHSMYGGGAGFNLVPHADQSITKLLDQAMQNLPRGILLQQAATGSKDAEIGAAYAPDNLKEGQFTTDKKGAILQRQNGKMVKAEAVAGPDGAPLPAKVERVKAMIGLRDKLNELLLAMNEMPDDELSNSKLAKQRDELKGSYDKFVKKHGILNSPANSVFEDDPHYPRLLALETYDRAARASTPSDIFTKRTIFPRKPLNALAPGAKDALNQILAERGYPDMELMAKLKNVSVEDAAKELAEQGLIFRDPVSGLYQTREKYLSGYVRDKLADAKKMVAQGEKAYAPNVKELEAIQPEDVPIKDIDVKLGATWIPLPAFSDFLHDVLKTNGEVRNSDGTWKVQIGARTAEVTAEFGTKRIHADELMQLALNQKEPSIKDRLSDGSEVLNKDETLAARQAQAKLKTAFNDWATQSVKWGSTLEKAYNYAYNNIVLPEYDGSHLTFPGMNAAVELQPHQKAAVWRIIQDRRGLLAHVVGAGKTYENVAAIMELRRLGIYRKPMVAVPNHLVEQWRTEWMHLYPGANLLVPTERDFDAKNRQRLMSKIATGDYDAVVLAHSQFNLMDISPERQLVTLNAQLDELEETIRSMTREDARTVKQMEKSREKLKQRMDKLRDLKADQAINFDDTGVDALFVDEAHEYKNLAFYTKMTRIAGLSQGDAKRALRLKMKTEYLQDKNDGAGVVFSTGTPIQNTMAEQYSMTKYVAPDVLAKAGIRFFDDWAANFGSVVTKPEISADGRSFKIRNKFSRFTNVPELMNMFRSFTDVKTARDLNLPIPKQEGGKPEAHLIEPSAEVDAYVQSLIFRARQIAGEVGVKPDPKEDNMLKVTSDGRKAATDMRLVHPDAADDPESKINHVVADVYHEWLAGKEKKATQLVFLDMYRAMESIDLGGGKKGKGRELINLYHDMRAKWIKAGIPADEIAIIGEYKTKEARQKLFDQMKKGEKRILMGSTQKMGAGMNVQKRLAVLHHVDNPWRPGDVEQRNGRILRQGNENESVKIKHWLVKQSFDTYMLQALESKANFIDQVMNGRYEGRTMEDVGSDMTLNLAEMKVAASGNPDVKKKYDLESERSTLLSLERGHESQRRDNTYRAATLRSQASAERAFQTKAGEAVKAIKAAKGDAGDGFKAQLDGKDYTDRESFGEVISKMDVPAANFHMQINGIGVIVETFNASNLPVMDYMLDYENEYHGTPARSMESLVRSVEARLTALPRALAKSQENTTSLLDKSTKLDELAKGQWDKQPELDRVTAELAAVDKRLGLGPKEAEQSVLAEADDGPDEDEGDEDEDDDAIERPAAKGGTTMRASVFGLDIAAEFLGKQAKAFYKSDVGPAIAKVAETAKAAGKHVAEVLYPRFNANEDALDSIMAAKGQMERSRFVLEHINGGLEKFFDKMTLDQHLAFIDRYKLGVGQPTPELEQVEMLMRSIDAESLKLAQQYRPNLTAKENHFRVLWKVIPNSKAPGPQPERGNPTNYRRPYEGDKGFMKRATLDTISEGINYGGVPYTTNPWKLFSMAQASIKKYIAAQEHWANLKKYGLRKFVPLGEGHPPGWMKVDDRIGDVYFRAESGEGSVHSGRWYLEPSSARILNNFLSRDLIRENPIGNALLLAKNLTTALSLSLSPFHFLFETIEAMGSQLAVGAQRIVNVAARKGDYGQGLLGLREMGSFVAAPVLYARTGGSMLRATASFKDFAQTKRGQAFLTQFPDAVHQMDLFFKGGGQYNMNPDYRTDLVKSFREAAKEQNYVGAALRIFPALSQAIMTPLFDVYIPRLKMGFFLAQNSMKQLDMERELSNGDTTELKIARQTVDAMENRFGELNFSNLFWNNTFKSVMQFVFRSVTWKLGNWRGAGAGAAEARAFLDPLKAMYEDAKAGKARPNAREAYLPRLGMNLAWLLGMGTVAALMGTVISKAFSGRMPWEWATEDKKNDHSLPGAVLLEMMHPRTGRRDPRTGLPERVTLPIGLKDFEHALRDPKGYLEASESDLLSRSVELARNRDFFGDYVYDPNAALYQQVADGIYHLVPQPMALQGVTQTWGAQDKTSKALRFLGVGNTSKSLDETPLERALEQQQRRDRHDPMTPEQVKRRYSGDRMKRHVTAGELRRHIRQGRMSHVERLAESMTYSDLKRIFDREATPHEKRLLGPMLAKKRSNLLRKDGYSAVQSAER